MLNRTGAASAVAVLLVLGAGPALHARPAHKQALADYFGPFLARGLNDCRTCHVPEQPGEAKDDLADDKPHNSFGARLKAVKQELHRAGKPTTIADRLEAVAQEDSDGDGVPNLIEILTGHNPGDPQDRPTPAELARAEEVLAAFRKAQQAYPWRPFAVVHRPPVPVVQNAAWVRNPIDAFIAAEHEAHGLMPRPEASKAVLLRRVYLDLVGLPPTPQELHAFLDDTSPDAYEQVVDHLLASPHYGERWGRHWMDVWRYSDWAGYGQQVRDSQPHVWRWRDWIIESLNQDKGYDRMVLEMLAGDELAPDDPDVLRATGYLVRNYKLLSREKWMEDVVDHTAQAFLGVTLGCARCHDHMYDPISQKEYYQVRAVFEPHQVRIDKVPGQLDTGKDGLARAYDAKLDVKTFLFLRGDERTPEKTPLAPGVPVALGGKFSPPEPVKLPLAAYAPDRRPFVRQETRAIYEPALEAADVSLQKTQAARRELARALVTLWGGPALAGLAELGRPYEKALPRLTSELGVLLARAKHAALLAELAAEQLEDEGKQGTEAWKQTAAEALRAERQRDVLQARWNLRAAGAGKGLADAQKALAKAETELNAPLTTAYTGRGTPTYPTTSTGRRLAFARWIADARNPLTARVAMNHVWLRHFGQAIVPSVFDFGRNGRPPSHPALLDWLAAEFMERGWRFKAMHRLIVTSSTYRLASTPDPADLALDRDNRYLWRMPSRRLEAELVRDDIFYVAGSLDPRMGGTEIDHHEGLTNPRRSVYFRQASEKQMEFLRIFDCAAVTECYQRKESVVPQQALALANSELTLAQARLLARSLAARVGPDPAAFAVAAFERVLARPPSPVEVAECVAFLQRQGDPGAASHGTPSDLGLRARESLVHVLLNHNDFVTIR